MGLSLTEHCIYLGAACVFVCQNWLPEMSIWDGSISVHLISLPKPPHFRLVLLVHFASNVKQWRSYKSSATSQCEHYAG